MYESHSELHREYVGENDTIVLKFKAYPGIVKIFEATYFSFQFCK